MSNPKRKKPKTKAIKVSPDIATIGTSITSSESQVSVRQIEYFEGPLPPPDLLNQYNRITKGAANRIITMAEKQGKHRREIEKDIVRSNIRSERVGMYYSFVITIGLMIIGGVLILYGHEVTGFLSVFGPAIFHAGNYLYNRYGKPEEKQS